MTISTCAVIARSRRSLYSRLGGRVGGMSIKVGSAVGVVTTVSSVGGVVEVLLSRIVDINCSQEWEGVCRI